MVINQVCRWCSLRAGIALVVAVLVMSGGTLALANDGVVGGIVPEATPGGPGQEPTPSRDDVPGEDAGNPEATPPPGTPGGNPGDALAPGSVTVIVRTSDGGPLPQGAMVCIGTVCQPIGGARSGVDLRFDQMKNGWQQVVVNAGPPYSLATVDVQVQPGRNSAAEFTLVLTPPSPGEMVGPSPSPVSAPGPVRVSAQQSDPIANAPNVSALPSTGVAQSSTHAATLATTLTVITGLLLAAAIGVRVTSRN